MAKEFEFSFEPDDSIEDIIGKEKEERESYTDGKGEDFGIFNSVIEPGDGKRNKCKICTRDYVDVIGHIERQHPEIVEELKKADLEYDKESEISEGMGYGLALGSLQLLMELGNYAEVEPNMPITPFDKPKNSGSVWLEQCSRSWDAVLREYVTTSDSPFVGLILCYGQLAMINKDVIKGVIIKYKNERNERLKTNYTDNSTKGNGENVDRETSDKGQPEIIDN